MAVIAMFYGIIVSMYYFDTRQHHLPHIHVKYQEQEAVMAIPSDDVLEGDLQRSRLRLVQAWIEIHRDELMADWELASQGPTHFQNRSAQVKENTDEPKSKVSAGQP